MADNPTPIRVSRLSVAAVMESVRIREAVEALDKHRARVLYALASALVSRLFMAAYTVQRTHARAEDIAAVIPELSLAVLAYAAVLWFMALRGRDRFGFGIALGVAVLEATTQVVSLVRLRPFDLAAAWPMLLIFGTHVWLAVAAFQASMDFPSRSSSRPWLLGFLLAVLFTVAMPSLRTRVANGGVLRPERVLTRTTVPSAALASAVSMVNRCAKSYADSNRAAGYPRALAALGPAPQGNGCITDSLVVAGEGPGWMITYAPGQRDATGRVTGYSIYARQSPRDGQGVGFFESDESGAIRVRRPGS